MDMEKAIEQIADNQEGTHLALSAVAESLTALNSYVGSLVRKQEEEEDREDEMKKQEEEDKKEEERVEKTVKMVLKQIKEEAAKMPDDPNKQQDIIQGAFDPENAPNKESGGDDKAAEDDVTKEPMSKGEGEGPNEANIKEKLDKQEEDKDEEDDKVEKRLSTLEKAIADLTKAVSNGFNMAGFAPEATGPVTGGNLGLAGDSIRKSDEEAHEDLIQKMCKMSHRELVDLEEKVARGEVTLG